MLELGLNDDLGIVLAMVYVAWADDVLTKSELDAIVEEAADQGLDEQELLAVKDAITNSPEPDEISRLLSTSDAKKAALSAAYAVSYADAAVDFREVDALKTLARAFQLCDADVEQVSAFARQTLEAKRSGHADFADVVDQLLAVD